jgi:hypothetical protein
MEAGMTIKETSAGVQTSYPEAPLFFGANLFIYSTLSENRRAESGNMDLLFILLDK